MKGCFRNEPGGSRQPSALFHHFTWTTRPGPFARDPRAAFSVRRRQVGRLPAVLPSRGPSGQSVDDWSCHEYPVVRHSVQGAWFLPAVSGIHQSPNSGRRPSAYVCSGRHGPRTGIQSLGGGMAAAYWAGTSNRASLGPAPRRVVPPAARGGGPFGPWQAARVAAMCAYCGDSCMFVISAFFQ